LSTLPVVGTRDRFDTTATNTKGVVWAIIDIGTCTIGTDTGLLFTDLALVCTVTISSTKISPLLTSTVQTTLIVRTL